MNALVRLQAAVESAMEDVPPLRVGGIVREVTPTYFRVSGISSYLRLGDRVGIDQDGRTRIGEVVRVDEAGAAVKPFDERVPVGDRKSVV